MTVRATSIYTAHFATPAEADRFARSLPVPIQDHGHTAISYRAADDAEAATVAASASIGAQEPGVNYHLTTGLGVHRRDVQP